MQSGLRRPARAALWAAFAAVAGSLGAATAAAQTPVWGTSVRLAGVVWRLPAAVTGLGYAGPGRLWVFLSGRAVEPPAAVWEVDPTRQRVLLRIALGRPTPARGVAPDGALFAAPNGDLEEWWQGGHHTYRLPTGAQVVALAPVSHSAVWLALRLGRTGRVEVALYRLPKEVVVDAHHVAGMANETVAGLAAAPGGAWLVSAPRPTLYWVAASGGPSTSTDLYATAFFPTGARTLAAVAVDARNEGWLSGYTTAGHGAVWRLDGVAEPGPPLTLPAPVNMVSAGLAVARNGVGYVGFSAIGGTSGYPGVAAVAPTGRVAASVWPQLAVPGGGVGPLLLTPTGQLWAGMPFSHLLLPLKATS